MRTVCPSFHSLVVSPKLEPSTDPYPSPLPSYHSSGRGVDFASLVSPLHHTNPFCQSQATPPTISPCNPFFSLLQQNPFFKDMLNTQDLKPPLPPLPCLSSSRPPIVQFFPQASNPNPSLTHDNPATHDAITETEGKSEVISKAEKCRAPTEEENHLRKKSSNPFMPAGKPEPDSEWDESFEAFAAGRLQSPEEMTTYCKKQQNTSSDHPLEHCDNERALLPMTDADQSTNLNDTLHPQPFTEFVFEAHKVSQMSSTNKHHLYTFAQMLETIPEHLSFDSDNLTLNTSSDLPKPDACTEMNQTNNTTNTNDLTSTNSHQDLCQTSSSQLNSSSPDPGSSGLGSSAEEDFLSCLSSYSDKFSASSCEEAETQNIESNNLGIDKSSESPNVKNSKPSESEDDITDMPNDLSLADVTLQAFVLQQDSVTPHSPDLKHQQLMITAEETETEDAKTLNISSVVYPDLLPNLSELQPKSDISSQSYHECKEQGIDEFSSSIIDFSKKVNNSPVNNKHVMIPTTPDDKLCSKNPSSFIITSSPDVRRSSSDSPFESTSLGGLDANQHSPVPFGTFADFLSTNPVQDLDDNLLHTVVSDRRHSSFLQSLYASTDSQVYQICESHLSSKYFSVSEPNEMLHSALCGELSKIQMIAGTSSSPEDSPNAQRPSRQQINQNDRLEEPFCGAEDNTAALDPSFKIGDDFQVLPAAQTDSYVCCNPRKISEKGVESQHAIFCDEFSKCLQAQSVPLHRSQSEGTLTPFFDKLLLPSFGSDPSAINESYTVQPGPVLLYLSSNDPPLITPESISSPVALCSLPPLASALVRSPPSTAPDSAPKPMPQEPKQQQAANQQNR